MKRLILGLLLFSFWSCEKIGEEIDEKERWGQFHSPVTGKHMLYEKLEFRYDFSSIDIDKVRFFHRQKGKDFEPYSFSSSKKGTFQLTNTKEGDKEYYIEVEYTEKKSKDETTTEKTSSPTYKYTVVKPEWKTQYHTPIPSKINFTKTLDISYDFGNELGSSDKVVLYYALKSKDKWTHTKTSSFPISAFRIDLHSPDTYEYKLALMRGSLKLRESPVYQFTMETPKWKDKYHTPVASKLDMSRDVEVTYDFSGDFTFDFTYRVDLYYASKLSSSWTIQRIHHKSNSTFRLNFNSPGDYKYKLALVKDNEKVFESPVYNFDLESSKWKEVYHTPVTKLDRDRDFTFNYDLMSVYNSNEVKKVGFYYKLRSNSSYVKRGERYYDRVDGFSFNNYFFGRYEEYEYYFKVELTNGDEFLSPVYTFITY